MESWRLATDVYPHIDFAPLSRSVFQWIALIDTSSLAAVDPCDLWLVQRLTRENRLSCQNPGHSVHMRSHDRSAAAPPQPKGYSFIPQDVWRACGCSWERTETNNLQAGVDLVFCLSLFTSAFFSLSLSLSFLYLSVLVFSLSFTHLDSMSFFLNLCLCWFLSFFCSSLCLFLPGPVFLCLSFLLSLTFCLFHGSFCLYNHFVHHSSFLLSFFLSLSVSFLLSTSVLVLVFPFFLSVYLFSLLSVSLSVFLSFCFISCVSHPLSLFFAFSLSFFHSYCLPVCRSLSPPLSAPLLPLCLPLLPSSERSGTWERKGHRSGLGTSWTGRMTGTDREIETDRVDRTCVHATLPPHIKTNHDPPLRGRREKGPIQRRTKAET